MEKEIRSKPELLHRMDYVLLHLSPLLIIVTGATVFDWILCGILYFVRMFFVCSGYHRYFSHATFKTSRAFQLVLAFMAQTTMQKGVLWWAANHRTHHKYTDKPQDPHSPKIYGFWYAHMGWFLSKDYLKTDFSIIKDFSKFPELRWLNRNHVIPALILMLAVYLLGGLVNANGDISMLLTAGLSTLIVGFFLSTILVYHGTYSINSLMHIIGRPRYESNDESKNSFWLALVTLGEGWHNNHHYFQSSVRQGFYWWEIDVTYYLLKILSWFGIVWDLRPVPIHIKNSRTKEEARLLAKKQQM